MTQLGAWAEQRHTWALHSKMSVMVLGSISPPKGMVAPYPDFFAGLAKLSRRTAEAFQRAGLDQEFDAKIISDQLLNLLDIEQKGFDEGNVMDLMEKHSGEFQQLGSLQEQYYKKHQAELEKVGSRNVHKQIQNDLRGNRLARFERAGDADGYGHASDILRQPAEYRPVTNRLRTRLRSARGFGEKIPRRRAAD